MVLFAGRVRVAHFVTVYALDPDHAIIDMHASHLWDASTCVGRIRSRAAVFFVNVRDPVLVSVDGLFRLYGTVLTVPGAQDCRR